MTDITTADDGLTIDQLRARVLEDHAILRLGPFLAAHSWSKAEAL